MRADRLLKLADFLDTVPPEHFDMNIWVRDPPNKEFSSKAPFTCGFAGCALGWAAHAKLFKGLKILDGWVPMYEGVYEFAAAELLFNISYDDSGFLFAGEATPPEVAKRIRAFVESHKEASTP